MPVGSVPFYQENDDFSLDCYLRTNGQDFGILPKRSLGNQISAGCFGFEPSQCFSDKEEKVFNIGLANRREEQKRFLQV
jgi:hypothetical protein